VRLIRDDCGSLHYATLPVGMTKGGWLVSGRMASWLDRAECGYSATTADPSTALRSGRDDKGRVACFRKDGELDGQS
jgi:hypothetical protein